MDSVFLDFGLVLQKKKSLGGGGYNSKQPVEYWGGQGGRAGEVHCIRTVRAKEGQDTRRTQCTGHQFASTSAQ